MTLSIGFSVAALALVAGCSSSLQIGLANAPAYGKDTEETRVHTVIANGRDACQRSEFPAGEVLRGHTPPCPTTEPKPVDLTFFPDPAALSVRHFSRGLGACAIAESGFTRAELNMPEEPLASRDVDCDEP